MSNEHIFLKVKYNRKEQRTNRNELIIEIFSQASTNNLGLGTYGYATPTLFPCHIFRPKVMYQNKMKLFSFHVFLIASFTCLIKNNYMLLQDDLYLVMLLKFHVVLDYSPSLYILIIPALDSTIVH